MNYIPPEQVLNPVKSLKDIMVFKDGDIDGDSYSLLDTVKGVVFGVRRNGNPSNINGSPIALGLPTWTVISDEVGEAVLNKHFEENKEFIEAQLYHIRNSKKQFVEFMGYDLTQVNMVLLAIRSGKFCDDMEVIHPDDSPLLNSLVSYFKGTYHVPIKRPINR